jgi:GntR family transcriptional regulator, transcriptional repressor for pyruvate dehydrogenase complex
MPIQAIEPRRLYRQIAEQLRGLIQRGEYPVGSRLPAERELALQLGVSRPSVREALIALEVEGLVEVRGGSGVVVLARRAPPASRTVGNAYGPFEIMRARQVLEGELAALAARHMKRNQVAQLHEALAGMEADITRGQLPLQGDRQFHLCIAQAADNAPLLRSLEQLYDERNNPLCEHFGHRFENVHTWRKALEEHAAVVQAIAARDPEGARQQMHRHLQRSQSRYASMNMVATPARAA